LGENVADPTALSGAGNIHRGISRGDQHYTTDPKKYPIGQPVKKLESMAQVIFSYVHISIPYYFYS